MDMGNGRWQLVVESNDGLSVQLPLEIGTYRVGREAGADFALAKLSGRIEVTAESVSAVLQEREVALGSLAQEVEGLRLRVQAPSSDGRRTTSMPRGMGAQQEIEPLLVTEKTNTGCTVAWRLFIAW